MRWGQLILCGWPGLAQLWCRGSYRALLVAVGFSILLNLALISTFLWPALLGDIFPAVAWPIIFIAWLVSALTSVRLMEQLSAPPKMSSEQERDEFSEEKIGKIACDLTSDCNREMSHTLFNRAQREYLMGHWSEAESLLKRRLSQAERDIEARLLLATLFRHTSRFDLATEQLKQMEKFDDSVHWSFEIYRERQLIELSQSEAVTNVGELNSTRTD